MNNTNSLFFYLKNCSNQSLIEQPINQTLQTTIHCVGSSYHQSCLYKNLYFVDGTFTILTVKGVSLPSYGVRTNAFSFYLTTPKKREFPTYDDLENFVRTVIQPKIIPSLTLHFGQYWHYNIGHALFDGLYPAYVALIRFSPRHLHPFRILADISDCNDCWSEDVYSRFAGLGILKLSVLKRMSQKRWFLFDELIMGSGTMCQRCIQSHFQLYGGVELNASRLFRDRMYQQHGLIPTVIRKKSSAEHRSSKEILSAYIIHNKRFTQNDTKAINEAINEINQYTNMFLTNLTKKSQWPLINVTYLYYNKVIAQNLNLSQINATKIDSRILMYELIDNKFIAQLKLLQKMDIHISGPGTGQMYQTFLSDGSVNINLGGTRGGDSKVGPYTSYMEQYMTSGTPYIKGLYYPINDRPKGIEKDEVVGLIRKAGQIIMQGFHLPVNPHDNLAADGQLFVEMCKRDQDFCSLVTTRLRSVPFICQHLWVEDLVHEYRHWSIEGYTQKNTTTKCFCNHKLLHELRNKYGIQHKNLFNK